METIQMLGSIGEFVGAIGVVVTLVYLSIQVRHSREAMEANTKSMDESRRAMVAQSTQARSFRRADRAERLAESGHIARIRVQLDEAGYPDDPSSVERLDPVDRLRMRQWLMANAQLLFNSGVQFRLGYLPEETLERYLAIAHRNLEGPMRAFEVDTSPLRQIVDELEDASGPSSS